MNSSAWATWEPGKVVSPGDVGTFNRQRQFVPGQTLRGLGATSARYSQELPIGARFFRSATGLRFEHKVTGQSAAGFELLGEADAGVRITAEGSHACVLQMLEATEKSVINKQQVMDEVLARLRKGEWSVDWQIVMSRVRSRKGFAAISQGAGQSLELKAAAHLHAGLPDLGLGAAEFALASSHATTDFLLYVFSDRETPTFGLPVRVKSSLWDRLLPWRTEGEFLIGPDGRRYPPRMVAGRDLSAFAPEDRRYEPARSAMPEAELAALTAADVFEEVTSLPDEADPIPLASVTAFPPVVALAEVIRFPLPLPVQLAQLAAADDSSRVPARLDASSPSGMAHFTLHEQGGEPRLEVSLAPTVSLPAVVFLRYGTVGGPERDLAIPLWADADRPSSVVHLEGYSDRVPLRPAEPLSPREVASWPIELVRRSVRAAATAATADAWAQLVPLVPASAAGLIASELRVLRHRT